MKTFEEFLDEADATIPVDGKYGVKMALTRVNNRGNSRILTKAFQKRPTHKRGPSSVFAAYSKEKHVVSEDVHHSNLKEGDQVESESGEKHEYSHTEQGLGRKVVHFSSGITHPTNKTGHLVGFRKTGVNFKK